jgi:hypothetical protein
MNFNGQIIGSKIFGGKNDDELSQLISTKDGGIMTIGTSFSFGDSLGDFWINKFNVNLDSTWSWLKGGSKMEVGRSIVEDVNSDYIAIGGSETYTNGQEDVYIVKFDKNRNVIWERNYGFKDQNEEGFCIKNSNSSFGSMMVCYSTKEDPNYKTDAKALLLNSGGYYIDGGRVGSTEDDEVFSIANCKDKGYALVGYTEGFGARLKDVFIIKFDSLVHGTGTLLILSNENYDIFDNQGVSFSPNPFQDYINLDIRNEKDNLKEITLINIDGHIIESNLQISENGTLNLSKIMSGIYFLRVITKFKTSIFKIVCIK